MDIHELAQKVIGTTAEKDRSKTGYYMTNINHPVIAAMMHRFREKNKIPLNEILPDAVRVEFELWLFQPSIRTEVENLLKGKEDEDNEQTPEHEAGGRNA